MTKGAHLWAVGFDDMKRAEYVRAEIIRLAEKRSLILLDTAIAVRYPDGIVTLDGEPFVSIPRFDGRSFATFLAGLALGAPPLTVPVVGAFQRAAGGTAADVGIREDFIQESQALMKPATSALFVLDQEGEMHEILQGIRGLGGTILKTNVDMERARLVQSTLAVADDGPEVRP
jgi:uncharacterized membrane protein